MRATSFAMSCWQSPPRWASLSFHSLALVALSACTQSAPDPIPPERPSKPLSLSAQPTGTVGSRGRAPRSKASLAPRATMVPCKGCSVSASGEVQGQLRPLELCGPSGKPITYPVRRPEVEVLVGAQAGQRFPVLGLPKTLAGVEVFEGKLSSEARVSEWKEALFWVSDSTGARCPSTLKISK